MALVDIQTTFYSRLESVSDLLPIRYPDIETNTTQPEEYIIPNVLPNTTTPYGVTTTDQLQGILQVRVYTRKGKGELYANRIAQRVIDAFPRNSIFDTFRIDSTGTIAPPFTDGAFKVTPVSIEYYCFTN